MASLRPPRASPEEAKWFLEFGNVGLEVTEPVDDMSPECRNAQASLEAATESVRNALGTARVMNALDKLSREMDVRGQYTGQAQDALRSALLFAGAGLDFSLKALARNAVPLLVEFDEQAHEKFEKFATAAMTSRDSEGVDPAALVKLLLGKGEAPKGILLERWVSELGGSSAQSTERVSEIAGALGVKADAIRRRTSTANKDLLLTRAFHARNQMSHELDLTHPSAERRAALERRKRIRTYSKVEEMAKECLDVTQLIINDVSDRLVLEPVSVG